MLRLAFVLISNLSLALATAAAPATQPVAADRSWAADSFRYDRPKAISVEESTPTPEQLNVWARAPRFAADMPPPLNTGSAKPASDGHVNRVHWRFRNALGVDVPAVVSTPLDKKGPFPVVIAIHGFTSHKAQVDFQMVPTLSAQGFAVIVFDLPGHGERPGDPFALMQEAKDPKKALEFFQDAVIDVRQLIDIAETRPELETKSGVYVVGYSLGSWVASLAGPSDPRIKAMVLMVAGLPDLSAQELQDKRALLIDPGLSLQHFTGRPILMLNGKTDGIVKPDIARRLFEVLPEPKKQDWFDSGHLLPAEAYTESANWLVTQRASKGLPAQN